MVLDHRKRTLLRDRQGNWWVIATERPQSVIDHLAYEEIGPADEHPEALDSLECDDSPSS